MYHMSKSITKIIFSFIYLHIIYYFFFYINGKFEAPDFDSTNLHVVKSRLRICEPNVI